MGKYAADREALAALVRDAEVHRDVYVDDEVFALEMRHLFANTWVYVGHESEVASSGDYITTEIGARPVIMVRGEDGDVHVLHNRCPPQGHPSRHRAGGQYRAPLPVSVSRLDVPDRRVPLRHPSRARLRRHAPRGAHRREGNGTGPGRALAPRLRVRAPCRVRDRIRRVLRRVALEPRQHGGPFAGRAARGCGAPASLPAPVQLEDARREPDRRLPPDGRARVLGGDRGPALGGDATSPRARRSRWRWRSSPPSCRATSSSRRWGSGCGRTVTATPGCTTPSTPTTRRCPATSRAWAQAWGEERARAILGENRHNTIYFPNTMVKGPIQLLRRFQPLAADRTLVESYVFRLVDAPDMLLERTVMYNRLINAPTSIVGHDDLEIYERMQAGACLGRPRLGEPRAASRRRGGPRRDRDRERDERAPDAKPVRGLETLHHHVRIGRRGGSDP